MLSPCSRAKVCPGLWLHHRPVHGGGGPTALSTAASHAPPGSTGWTGQEAQHRSSCWRCGVVCCVPSPEPIHPTLLFLHYHEGSSAIWGRAPRRRCCARPSALAAPLPRHCRLRVSTAHTKCHPNPAPRHTDCTPHLTLGLNLH